MPEESERRALLISKAWLQARRRLPPRLLRPRPARLPDLQSDPPIPDQAVDPRGTRLHGRRHPRGPAGLPPQRPDGVRLDLRARRVPRARTSPPTTCIAPRVRYATSTAAPARIGACSGRSRTSRPTGTIPRRARSQYSAAQAAAFEELRRHYAEFFASHDRYGLRPSSDRLTREQIRQLTAFFSWSAWAASARRPGPRLLLHQQLAARGRWWPTSRRANVVVWSVLSLIALLGGHRPAVRSVRPLELPRLARARAADAVLPSPGEVALTPAQRATAYFFLTMAGLFLIQTLMGGASQHYRAELGDFFGIDLAQLLPYNLARTWHVQLAHLLGRHLVPRRRDLPRADDRGAGAAAPALARLWPARRRSSIVVFGQPDRRRSSASTAGRGEGSGLSAIQGFEYLDLGRFWQVLLSVGLFFWVAILFRGLRARLQSRAGRQHALAVLLRRAGDPRLLRRGAARPSRAPISPRPTTGGSGWCTSGSRTSWSCSRP